MSKSAIIVTGASSGIGAALAQSLSGPQRVLGLLGRDPARLDRVAAACRSEGADCVVRVVDVLDRDGMSKFVVELSRDHPIDLLVANAGIFQGRRADQIVETGDVADLVLRTNLVSTIDLIHMVLPDMINRRRGRILVMASLAGLFPLPDAAAYSASKAGLISYGLALRDAVASQGIKVVVACPGYVTTPLIGHHHGLRLGEVPVEVAVRRILDGLERNRSLVGFPSALFWLTRGYLLAPEVLRRKAMALFRFHLS